VHVKTAGTSYLEALRVLVRRAQELFVEIVEYALSRYAVDCATYHVSADLSKLPDPRSLDRRACESIYLDENSGRQVLHVTFGSVLCIGQTARGRPFQEALLEVLEQERTLYHHLLAEHLGRHIQLLQAG
jgi:hypothetical protein